MSSFRQINNIKDLFASKKSIIFDLDGTITDTEQIYEQVWTAKASKYGLVAHPDFAFAVCGTSKESCYNVIKKYYPNVNPKTYRDDVMSEVASIMEHTVPLKPGATDLIKFLYEQDYSLDIASGNHKPQIKKNLKKIGLLSYFTHITSGDEVVHGKPAPDEFLVATKKTGHKLSECLVIEDADNGVKAAYAAGCDVIMVPDMKQPTKEIKKMCIAIYNSLEDLLNELK